MYAMWKGRGGGTCAHEKRRKEFGRGVYYSLVSRKYLESRNVGLFPVESGRPDAV
jgi:hypothetical protein